MLGRKLCEIPYHAVNNQPTALLRGVVLQVSGGKPWFSGHCDESCGSRPPKWDNICVVLNYLTLIKIQEPLLVPGKYPMC